jgi:hypothetical protein
MTTYWRKSPTLRDANLTRAVGFWPLRRDVAYRDKIRHYPTIRKTFQHCTYLKQISIGAGKRELTHTHYTLKRWKIYSEIVDCLRQKQPDLGTQEPNHVTGRYTPTSSRTRTHILPDTTRRRSGSRAHGQPTDSHPVWTGRSVFRPAYENDLWTDRIRGLDCVVERFSEVRIQDNKYNVTTTE